LKYTLLKIVAIFTLAIGGMVNAPQPAHAADKVIAESSNGCAYSITRKSWWGAYTYLNGCAINEAVNELETASAILGFSTIAAASAGFYVAGPYGAGFFGAAVQSSSTILGIHKGRLSYCKEKTGQAYVRYYVGRYNYLGSYVSCD
jgi:hypothetical protein